MARKGVKANETPQEELLLRDVKILFDENRRIKHAAEMGGLCCPNCGRVMDPIAQNKFACHECKVAAEQTTIFSDWDEELKKQKLTQKEEEKEMFSFYLKSQLEYIENQAPHLKKHAIAAALEVSRSQLWQYEQGNAIPRNMRFFSKKLAELREKVQREQM